MIPRKFAFFLMLLSLFGAACQGEPAGSESAPAAAAPAIEGTPVPLQAIVPANDIATGRPRIPFFLYDGPQYAANVAAVEVVAFDLSAEEPEPVWQGSAQDFSDYEIPYWVVYPEFPHPGIWGLQVRARLDDGRLASANFAVEALADPEAPNVGETIPPSQNRTAADTDVKLLSSGRDPNPVLYQRTVADMVANGRPGVIAFNTPAFCQTAICAPVLRSVESVYPTYSDRVDFLHLEIYKEFDPLVVADEVGEWQLPSEPWTFVIDQQGVVAARLAGPVSAAELSNILDIVLEASGS